MNDPVFSVCPITRALRITGFCSAHENCKSAGYSYDGEFHDFWESLFVLQGCATVTAGREVIRLEGGEMIFYPPGEFHRIRNAGEQTLSFAVISFSADAFPLQGHRVCRFDAQQAQAVTQAVRALRQLFCVEDRKFLVRLQAPQDAFALQSTVNQLELLFLQLLCHAPSEQAPLRRDPDAARYTQAVAVMQAGLAENLTVPQIAAACSISVSALQKLFASTTGMGVMHYYTDLRMQQARRLLQQGFSVKEAAAQLGFADQNYFSTAYRRRFGIPPSKEIRCG